MIVSQANIAAITAAVIAALGAAKPAKSGKKYPAVKARKPYAPVLSAAPEDARADRQMKRLAGIARGFNAKGIKVTFDKATGKFDNVKPYKLWALEGRMVRKGQHGVKGFFHISQTDVAADVAIPSVVGANVTVLAPQTREHFDAQMQG